MAAPWNTSDDGIEAAGNHLANANLDAGEVLVDAANEGVNFWDNVRGTNEGLFSPFLGFTEIGQNIFDSDFMQPRTGPVTTEDDLRYYVDESTDWQNRHLDDAGVSLTYDEELNRAPFEGEINRGDSAGFEGRTPLDNKAPDVGSTNTRERAAPTSTRGYEDPTMRGRLKHENYEDFATGGNVDLELLRNDPGYQFRLAEGEKAIRRAANAGSGARTGATFKALMGHGQGLASAEYDAAYQRAMQQYRTNRENRFREQDDDFRLQNFDRQSQMRDQDNRFLTDTFNRQSEMRDQDNQFRTDTFNRDSQMRDQDNQFRSAEFDRQTDIRNQDTQLQDYLTNRDTEQINADRELQDFVTNRQTFQMNSEMQLQDYVTNRDTWQQNLNNVNHQVDRAFQHAGWAQSVLNVQNEQFQQQRQQFWGNMAQWFVGVGQAAAKDIAQNNMATGTMRTASRTAAAEAAANAGIGSASAHVNKEGAIAGVGSQNASNNLQVISGLVGAVGSFMGWF
ncbi:MAG: hypothetical protein OXD01_12795 [Gammaproteobacteria bacterium]|nr:hypothetical protein [Gammaproteobacteria bacterium]